MEVMGNIIDNACKYCLEFVTISARQQGNALQFIIEDDGPGIPPAKRETVIQRGQRADTLKPGQGLGLAIATSILERYRGKIEIAQSLLGGAKFTVTFADQEDKALYPKTRIMRG